MARKPPKNAMPPTSEPKPEPKVETPPPVVTPPEEPPSQEPEKATAFGALELLPALRLQFLWPPRWRYEACRYLEGTVYRVWCGLVFVMVNP